MRKVSITSLARYRNQLGGALYKSGANCFKKASGSDQDSPIIREDNDKRHQLTESDKQHLNDLLEEAQRSRSPY